MERPLPPILTDKTVTFTTCSITFTRCATSPATSICTSARKGRGRSRGVYISVGFEGLHASHGLFSSYHTILKLCIWNMVVIFSTIRTPQRPLGRGRKVVPNKCSNVPSVNKNTNIPVGGASVLPQNLHLGFEVEVAGYMSKMVNNSEVCCDEWWGTRYHVKVQSKTSKGEEYPHGGVEVKGEMRSKTHNGAVVYGEVEDHRDGTYTITLTPQTAGPHQLLITMDGQHVQNSPHDLDKLTSSGKFLHKLVSRDQVRDSSMGQGGGVMVECEDDTLASYSENEKEMEKAERAVEWKMAKKRKLHDVRMVGGMGFPGPWGHVSLCVEGAESESTTKKIPWGLPTLETLGRCRQGVAYFQCRELHLVLVRVAALSDPLSQKLGRYLIAPAEARSVHFAAVLVRPSPDTVMLTFQPAADDMDNMVLALGQKKTILKQSKDLEDLKHYSTIVRTKDLDSSLMVVSDSSEAVTLLLSNQIVAFLNKNTSSVEYIHLSDLHTGAARDSDDAESVADKEPQSGFNFHTGLWETGSGYETNGGGGGMTPSSVPLYGGGGGMTPSSVPLYGGGDVTSAQDPQSFVQFALSLLDHVKSIRLGREGKEKVQKGRLKVTQNLEKLQHSQRQEQRKEDKKKAEKVKMLNEPDPEKTRKWEEKEHLEEDGTQNEADENKGLNCYIFCLCYT
eukprot:Em0593g3a